MKKKIIYIVLSLLLIIATTIVLLVFIKSNKKTYENTSFEFVQGNEIPEGTDLNTKIHIKKLYKIDESDRDTNDFIYKDTIILIDSSPVRRELDKGITTCWITNKKNELIQVDCSNNIIKKIADKYKINTYEAKNVNFNLIYKIK